MARLGEEVGQDAAVELGLAQLAALQEVLARRVEGALEEGEEGQGLRRQDLALRLLHGAEDGDALEDVVGGSHGCGGGGYNGGE